MKWTATLLALPFLVVANPLQVRQGAGSCTTGSLQCCNTTVTGGSPDADLLSSLLGLALGGLTGDIGVQCSPLNVIGVDAGNACTSNPVCCNNTQSGGTIGVGCLPIDL